MASEKVPIDITGDGSVVKVVTKRGQGTAKPKRGDSCSVLYVGRVQGVKKPFDSSGTKPFCFEVGGPVIKGWNEAVVTMLKGERAIVTIQPEKGYGNKGAGEEIPPDSVLEFEMELLSFEKKEVKQQQENKKRKIKLPEGVKKVKVLKEGIEPCIESDKYMVFPEDITPVTLHYKISLNAAVDGAIPSTDVVYDSVTEAKEGVKLIIDECMWPDGLDAAVKSMKKEEHSVFTITTALAWGQDGCEAKGVPPNTDIVVEIILLDFEHRDRVQDLSNEDKFVRSEKFRIEGNDYFQRGDIPRAQRRYSRALQMIQVNYDYTTSEKQRSREMGQVTYRNRSLCYIRMGEPRMAEADCKMAITLDPGDMIALYRHAIALIAIEENWDRAKQELQKVVKTLKSRGKSARQASKALKQLERKMDADYKKQKKLYGGFLHKERPDEIEESVDDRTQTTTPSESSPSPAPSMPSPEIDVATKPSAKPRAKKAAQTRRKMKLELYPDKKDTRSSAPSTAELVSDLSNDEDIEIDRTRLSHPCVQAAHKAVRWQALAVYVGMHAAYVMFIFASFMHSTASDVLSSQLATLVMLNVFMAVSVYQASKASGVNRFVRTLTLLTLGLCLNYQSRINKLSKAEAAAMVILDQLKSAELATNYRTGYFGVPYFEFYVLVFLLVWSLSFFLVATIYLGPRWLCEIFKTSAQRSADDENHVLGPDRRPIKKNT